MIRVDIRPVPRVQARGRRTWSGGALGEQWLSFCNRLPPPIPSAPANQRPERTLPCGLARASHSLASAECPDAVRRRVGLLAGGAASCGGKGPARPESMLALLCEHGFGVTVFPVPGGRALSPCGKASRSADVWHSHSASNGPPASRFERSQICAPVRARVKRSAAVGMRH